jgi:hypothetical protein
MGKRDRGGDGDVLRATQWVNILMALILNYFENTVHVKRIFRHYQMAL